MCTNVSYCVMKVNQLSHSNRTTPESTCCHHSLYSRVVCSFLHLHSSRSASCCISLSSCSSIFCLSLPVSDFPREAILCLQNWISNLCRAQKTPLNHRQMRANLIYSTVSQILHPATPYPRIFWSSLSWEVCCCPKYWKQLETAA